MDYYFYHDDINREGARKLASQVQARSNNPNKSSDATLYLVTRGGDPDAAYLIARTLQRNYQHFHVAVPLQCKSAGTLIALGAHTIYMSESGELGPLDMQLSRQDELAGLQSSLVATKGIDAVQGKAFASFEQFFLDILTKSGGRLASKTAADIAVRLTESLYRPIMEQFDPMRVGEYDRSTEVAMAYGDRLNEGYGNLQENSLQRLIYGYPSHGFVLDMTEAEELFHRVEPFTEALRGGLEIAAKLQDKHGRIFYIDEVPHERQANENLPVGATSKQEPAGLPDEVGDEGCEGRDTAGKGIRAIPPEGGTQPPTTLSNKVKARKSKHK